MHPDAAGAAVTGTRHTHRRTFKRRQRQEQFRAAVAFALALGTFTHGTHLVLVDVVGDRLYQARHNNDRINPPPPQPQTVSFRRRAATCR